MGVNEWLNEWVCKSDRFVADTKRVQITPNGVCNVGERQKAGRRE